jgi:hypothetical protein
MRSISIESFSFLGTTIPISLELVDYLLRHASLLASQGFRISNIWFTVFYPQQNKQISMLKDILAKILEIEQSNAFKDRSKDLEPRLRNLYTVLTSRLRVRFFGVNVEDINSLNDLENLLASFRDFVKRYIAPHRQHPRLLLVDITGGRKSVSAMMYFLANLLGAWKITHIVSSPETFRAWNESRDEIFRDLGENLNDLEAFTKAYMSRWRSIVFPDATQYKVVELIGIPYPESFLRKLRSIIQEENGSYVIYRSQLEDEPEIAKLLQSSCLVDYLGETRIYLKKEFVRMLGLLEDILEAFGR